MNAVWNAIKIIIKNASFFIIGAVFSNMVLLAFMAKPASELTIPKETEQGVIVLTLVLMMMYMIFFGIAGGAATVIGYNTIRIIRKKKNEKNLY